MEEIDKKYSVTVKTYLDQLNICRGVKHKLEELIEIKSNYENMLNSLNKELHNIYLINNMSKIKGIDNSLMSNGRKNSNKSASSNSFNYGFNMTDNSKKSIIEQEIVKIKKKLDPVDEDLNKMNLELLRNVNIYIYII